MPNWKQFDCIKCAFYVNLCNYQFRSCGARIIVCFFSKRRATGKYHRNLDLKRKYTQKNRHLHQNTVSLFSRNECIKYYLYCFKHFPLLQDLAVSVWKCFSELLLCDRRCEVDPDI